jgi:hypothetical protein
MTSRPDMLPSAVLSHTSRPIAWNPWMVATEVGPLRGGQTGQSPREGVRRDEEPAVGAPVHRVPRDPGEAIDDGRGLLADGIRAGRSRG